jgi:hypothetical protein
MSNKILILVLCGLFSGLTAFAQTIVPGGNVSGTWTAAGSPYLVQGNITIQADSTLNIEPGVVVDFQNSSFLQVNGLLEAVGTETDSILFTGTSWLGITFESAPDSSHLTYCIVRDVGMLFLSHGGITCVNSNPVISHSRISNNQGQGEWGAGGIMLYNNSNANISRCNISDNAIYHNFGGTGGGIKIRDSHPTITGCTISDNYGDGRGGGIDMLGSSSLDISNCTITGNVLDPYTLAFDNAGGGIASQGSDLTVTQCTISHNVGGNGGGGGIWIFGGDAMITYCTINNNNTAAAPPPNTAGGGIYADCDTLAVDHCTFVDNLVGDPTNFVGFSIHAEGSTSLILTNSIVKGRGFPDRLVGLFGASASITYSDFYLYRDAFVGNLPTGLGELTQVNANGDSCDVYSNIFMDPLFADATNSDYHLSWANWPVADSTKSPCIDAGDPSSPYDPDSTVADIGAFYFNQSVTENLILNPGCEDTLVNGEIPYWTEVIGSNWTQRTAGPDPYEGLAYFFPGVAALAELDQDVDVSAYKSAIDNGTQSFIFEGYVQAYPQNPPDQSRIILEFLDSLKTTKIDSFDSGNYSNTTEWVQITDTSLAQAGTRHIRIRLISTRRAGTNNDGYYDGLSLVAANITGIKEIRHNLPESAMLFQNYPNPFNPATTIRFDLPKSGKVQLIVYDILGRKVATLMNKKMPPGRYDVTWNAANFGSGLYFYQLQAGNFVEVRKMLLVK